MKKKSLTLIAATYVFLSLSSCGGSEAQGEVDTNPGASIQVAKSDEDFAPLFTEEEELTVTFMVYPDEGTMFTIKGEKDNIEVFIAVLPENLEEKKYELSLDENQSSNLSYKLRSTAAGTDFCCNANSVGFMNVESVSDEFIKASFELSGIRTKAKGSFNAKKK